MDCARGTVEVGIPKGEDATVGGHQPVAPAVGRGGHAHDGPVEMDCARRTVEVGIAKGEDATVRGH